MFFFTKKYGDRVELAMQICPRREFWVIRVRVELAMQLRPRREFWVIF